MTELKEQSTANDQYKENNIRVAIASVTAQIECINCIRIIIILMFKAGRIGFFTLYQQAQKNLLA